MQPETSYKVTVETSNRKVDRTTFKMLSEPDAKLVQDYQGQLVRLNLPKEEEALDLARLYSGKRLFSQAIDTLAAVKNATQKAAIHRMLGDLYLEVDLPAFAKSEYKAALAIATNERDIQEQAAAQYGLGIVSANLDNTDEAIRWLLAARASYETANNTALKTDVAHFLEEVYGAKQPKEAMRWFQEALSGYESLNNPRRAIGFEQPIYVRN